jgi:hypothetical protein
LFLLHFLLFSLPIQKRIIYTQTTTKQNLNQQQIIFLDVDATFAITSAAEILMFVIYWMAVEQLKPSGLRQV